jgi:acetylornithine/succinyldiaminopimelate/putrescine aminotransferase
MTSFVRSSWRHIAFVILTATFFSSQAAAKKVGRAQLLNHFHNASGRRVKLGTAQRVKLGRLAAREPEVVGARSVAFSSFQKQWKRLAPSNVTPFYIGGSGSEVNNAAIHEIAREVRQKRTAKSPLGRLAARLGAPSFITLSGAFIARNGATSEAGFQRAKKGGPHVDSPLHQTLDLRDGPLDKAEQRALDRLASKLKGRHVGALVVEPIPSAYGVLFYRKRFLRAVRALCDQKGVPLIFDETYTAGGLTAKFFAYQHYNVEPDFVVFGKGTLPAGAGIAKVSRADKNAPPYDIPKPISGFKVAPLVLHHGAKVLRSIADNGLIEQVARKGERLAAGLRKAARGVASGLADGHDGRREGGAVRGIGLLWHAGDLEIDGKRLGRLAPALTTTFHQIDALLATIAK